MTPSALARRAISALAFGMIVLLAPGAGAAPAPPDRDRAAEIARLEAQRASGVDRLVAIASEASGRARSLALRALGRASDPRAITYLRKQLAREEPGVAALAAEALGFGDATESAGELARVAVSGRTIEARIAALRSLGRLGGEPEVSAIGRGLEERDPRARAAAAHALAQYGRRRLKLPEPLRARLLRVAEDGDREVRFAAANALARLPERGRDAAVELTLGALARRMDEPELRAVALAGLESRGVVPDELLALGLGDADFRVRVATIRLFASERASAPQHAVLARSLAAELRAIVYAPVGGGTRAHVLIEALERLRPLAREVEVAAAAKVLGAAAEAALRDPKSAPVRRVLDLVHCLSAAITARATGSTRVLASCGGPGGTGWPLHERRKLRVRVLAEGVEPPDDRAQMLSKLALDADPRVRAEALAALIKAKEPMLYAAADRLVPIALADSDSGVVGAVADAIGERAAAGGVPPAWTDALVGRAMRVPDNDVELRLSMFEALAAAKVRAAARVLDGALSDPNAVVRGKAKEALRALGLTPKAVPARPGTLLPFDPADVLGRRPRLVIETARGGFVIELDPDAAPHGVAAIVSLARRGFYDGVVFHRVVPGFVVQGGDPTGSGWGGPGFLLPGEPTSLPFARGAVGLADAGPDTAGSQWFVTQAHSPHLEGRYTLVGHVVAGLEVVDSIVPFDRIDRVRVEGL